jgi:hypothetical protein
MIQLEQFTVNNYQIFSLDNYLIKKIELVYLVNPNLDLLLYRNVQKSKKIHVKFIGKKMYDNVIFRKSCFEGNFLLGMTSYQFERLITFGFEDPGLPPK